jgi:hypothetical protein
VTDRLSLAIERLDARLTLIEWMLALNIGLTFCALLAVPA